MTTTNDILREVERLKALMRGYQLADIPPPPLLDGVRVHRVELWAKTPSGARLIAETDGRAVKAVRVRRRNPDREVLISLQSWDGWRLNITHYKNTGRILIEMAHGVHYTSILLTEERARLLINALKRAQRRFKKKEQEKASSPSGINRKQPEEPREPKTSVHQETSTIINYNEDSDGEESSQVVKPSIEGFEEAEEPPSLLNDLTRLGEGRRLVEEFLRWLGEEGEVGEILALEWFSDRGVGEEYAQQLLREREEKGLIEKTKTGWRET